MTLGTWIRNSLMSVIFPPAILGRKWPHRFDGRLGPGIVWSFLQENLHAHKIHPFRGGGYLGFFEGEGKVPIFFFKDAWIFRLFCSGKGRWTMTPDIAFPHTQKSLCSCVPAGRDMPSVFKGPFYTKIVLWIWHLKS